MTTRLGNWMQTYTGKEFYPLDARLDEICIEDIAHALSMQTRYSGHCLQFYSVAEHCVLAATCVETKLKLNMLMHDASEAYLCDVPRPIKSSLTNYKEIEQKLEILIAQKFGLQFPFHEHIREIDNAMLDVERVQNMAKPPKAWDHLTDLVLPITLQFWTPPEAEAEFLKAFYLYGGYTDASPIN